MIGATLSPVLREDTMARGNYDAGGPVTFACRDRSYMSYMSEFDIHVRSLMLSFANLSAEEFAEDLETFAKRITELRQAWKQNAHHSDTLKGFLSDSGHSP